MYNVRTYSLLFVGIVVAFLATLDPALAQQQQYTPLVPGLGIPGLNSAGATFGDYLNALFDLAIVLGSILAVIIIAASGLQYMSTDAIYQKKDSVQRITYAVLGLLMLLGTWLFFNEIGGDQILDLKIEPSQTGTTAP